MVTGVKTNFVNGVTVSADTWFNDASGIIYGDLTTVASAATTAPIWASGIKFVDYTGTATATAFPNALQAGDERTLICAAACAFTAGPNMLIEGYASGTTFTAEVNDQVRVLAKTTTLFLLTIRAPAIVIPLTDSGVGVIGTSRRYAREDHIHPAVAMPTGTIIDFSGAVAPAGFLACPLVATNISRVTYAALFAAIGTLWGAGDGSTTFGMPYFPENYTSLQNGSSGVGTSTTGQIKTHSHTFTVYDAGGVGAVPARTSTATGPNVASTDTAGSTINGAAGTYILKCVKT